MPQAYHARAGRQGWEGFSSESPSKDFKSDRCLESHDSISSRAKLIGSALVHHHGQPINQQTKAGFNRRREVGRVGKDASPGPEGRRTWRERIEFSVYVSP